jgi:phosphoglycolate phosphatase-like HAD superfamily hydrolase
VLYMFDLDGTLFDTREAVRLAYLEAGAELPEDGSWWGRPAREWLRDPDGSIHRRKNAIYLANLDRVRTLPAFQLYEQLAPRVGIATGASRAAATGLLEYWGVPRDNLFPELSLEGKAELLIGVTLIQDVIYFDDDLEAVMYLRCRGLTVCHVE